MWNEPRSVLTGSYHWGSACPPNGEHGDIPIGYGTLTDYRTETDRPKDRRIKPVFLKGSPTTRPLAITSTVKRGEERKCRWVAYATPPVLFEVDSNFTDPRLVPLVPEFLFDTNKYSTELSNRLRGLRGADISGTVAEIEEVFQLVSLFTRLVGNVVFPCISNPVGPKCLGNLLKWIRRNFPDTRLRSLAKVKPIAKGISNGILTHNFVYAPLKNAIFDVAAATENAALRGTATRFNLYQKQFRSYESGIYKITEHYRAKSSVDVVFHEPWSSHVYYGNPMEWAWERIPFSFVADWIFNFQSVIAHYGALDNVKTITGTTTERRLLSAFQIRSEYAGWKVITPAYRLWRSHERKFLPPMETPLLFSGLFQNDSAKALQSAVALLVQQRAKLK